MGCVFSGLHRHCPVQRKPATFVRNDQSAKNDGTDPEEFIRIIVVVAAAVTVVITVVEVVV